jgi:hypothetical protein
MGKSNAAGAGLTAEATMIKKIIQCLLLSLVLVSISTTGASAGSTRSETETKNVAVSIHNASCDEHGKIAFDWVITNAGKQPVYIYATFLKGHAVSSDFDESSHLLTLWTSRPSEADFAVNAYPQAKFVKVQPGASLRGHFADSPKRKPPVIGATQLAFAVAFGQSTESVEAALREAHYVHPANPIVQWQQIAKSAPVPLHSCNLKSAMTASRDSTDTIDPQTGNLHLTIPLVAKRDQ